MGDQWRPCVQKCLPMGQGCLEEKRRITGGSNGGIGWKLLSGKEHFGYGWEMLESFKLVAKFRKIMRGRLLLVKTRHNTHTLGSGSTLQPSLGWHSELAHFELENLSRI